MLAHAASRRFAAPGRLALARNSNERGAPTSQQPEVHTMTETPSPEDKNETATTPEPEAGRRPQRGTATRPRP